MFDDKGGGRESTLAWKKKKKRKKREREREREREEERNEQTSKKG